MSENTNTTKRRSAIQIMGSLIIRSRRNIDFPETVKKFATMRYPQR